MKNTMKCFGIIAIAAIIAFAFAACDDDWGGGPVHTHQGGAWQYNATQHWRACAICGEEYGRANHTGSTCTVCGYSSGGPVGGGISWPNSSILTDYGLSGLSISAGATLKDWMVTVDSSGTLIIEFTGSSAHDNAITSCFTTNGWTLAQTVESNGGIGYLYTRNGFQQGVYSRDRDDNCTIYSMKSDGEIVWSYYSSYLTEYGLSGLSAPAGAKDIVVWKLEASGGKNILTISFIGSSENDGPITSCFTNNGWTSAQPLPPAPDIIDYYYTKAGFDVGYYVRGVESGTCVINVEKLR